MQQEIGGGGHHEHNSGKERRKRNRGNHKLCERFKRRRKEGNLYFYTRNKIFKESGREQGKLGGDSNGKSK